MIENWVDLLLKAEQYLATENISLAKQHFEQALDIARTHELHCIKINIEILLLNVEIYYTRNLELAIELGVVLVTHLNKLEYRDCKDQHEQAYLLMNQAFFQRDAIGYEQELLDSIAYTQEEFPHSELSLCANKHLLCMLDIATENYDKADERTQLFLDYAQNKELHCQANAYQVRMNLLYCKGSLEEARNHGQQVVELAKQVEYQPGVAFTQLWLAVYELYLGLEDASQLFNQGINHLKSFNIQHTQYTYEAITSYYELTGQIEQAHSVHKQQFEQLTTNGSLHDIAIAHLEYCRFLGRQNKSLDIAVKNARSFFNTLRKPHVHIKALQQIETGNYYQFPWQSRFRC